MSELPSLHICIATEQNVVNLIPALQYGAEEVWILETPGMKEIHSGRYLANALKGHNIQSRVMPLAEDQVELMIRSVMPIAEELDEASRLPVINITGGTKLMALTLVQELVNLLETSGDGLRVPLVYTDTQKQRLDWLGGRKQSDAMQPVVKIRDVLRVYGYQIHAHDKNNQATRAKQLDIARDRENQTNEMAAEAERYQNAISAFSWAASKAVRAYEDGRENALVQKFEYAIKDKPSLDYFGKLENYGLLAYSPAQQQVKFMTEEAARYCAGGWLEEFVALKAGKMDIKGNWDFNLEVHSAEGEVPNEIDLMVVHNNRTLVVECKAAKLDEDNIQNWLTKLGNLARRVGGRQATPMLVSMRKLNEHHIKRAKELNVLLCHGPQIKHFARHLQNWLNN